MPHEFEVSEEITLDATPEQVWEAIATGPGIDSWFMGHSEIEPRLGGETSHSMFGEIGHGTVTAYEPLKHFAYKSDESNGEFMAFEYLLEAREGGSTVLRFVHNGFLGDDWEEQYDALKVGDRKYLEKLAAYVKHFPGRTSAHNMFLPGPKVADTAKAWAAFTAAFGLTGPVAEGQAAHPQVGPSTAAGTVTHADEEHHTLIVANPDAVYMLMTGMGMAFAEVHSFNPGIDAAAIDAAWQAWLEKSVA
ncbi:MAG TPA: SRPBCC domain-containing protein [Streptosporangiaceae bacterium]|jgi:uncharacterized protein YndB with AHSA1/START domain